MAGADNPAEQAVVLEREARLSGSVLWDVQRAYYRRQGVQAWSAGTVPHYITSNPVIAEAYAQVVLGYLRDWQAALDPDRPMYLVELGGGSGRFAYLFLRRLAALVDRSPLRGVRWTYVLTDIAEESIAAWQAHPQLAPFAAAGQLDFASFDVASPGDLVLRRAGVALAAGAAGNPLVVIANYVFDSVPQDAFAVLGGRLHEALVTVTSSQPEPDPADPALLARIRLDFTPRPAEADYYGDPEWDRALADYARHLGDTHVLFPCAALQCLRHLEALSGGRMLLLAGDKGYAREAEIAGRGAPELVMHGSFSFNVNFHAIGRFFRERGGECLLADFRALNLDICAFALGSPPGEGHVETGLAYYERIGHGHPSDQYMVKKGLERHYAEMDAEQLVAWLRLSGWDTSVFCGVFPTLIKRAAAAPAEVQEELYWGVRQLWDNYFHIGEPWDVPFFLAMVLCETEHYPEALEHLRRSLALFGPDAVTSYNMGLCHYRLGDLPAAQARLDEALALDPACEAARSLRIKMRAEEGRMGGSAGA